MSERIHRPHHAPSTDPAPRVDDEPSFAPRAAPFDAGARIAAEQPAARYRRLLAERTAIGADLQRRMARMPHQSTTPPEAAVQRKIVSGPPSELAPGQQHALAAEGTRDGAGRLPHLEAIQRSFGRHDVGHVRAHTGGRAADSAAAMGAEAFATGDHVAFARAPDLHTAAHEAAHVVQQRGGVQLKANVGQTGDEHERHADEVADRAVRGDSAEELLDRYAQPGAAPAPGVQHQIVKSTGEPYGSFTYVSKKAKEQGLVEEQLKRLRKIFDSDPKEESLTLQEAIDKVKRETEKQERSNKRKDRSNDKKKKDEDESDSSENSGEHKKPRKEEDKKETKTEKKKDKGKEKEKGKKKEDKSIGGGTVGELVLKALFQVAGENGFDKDLGLLRLIVDPAANVLGMVEPAEDREMEKFRQQNFQNVTEDVEEGTPDEPVKGETRGWIAYTSCYNTAVELFKMLADEGGQLVKMGQTQEDIKGLRELYLKGGTKQKKTLAEKAQQTFTKAIDGLIKHMGSHGEDRFIYRVGYGIHGFALLLREGRVELLESFAGHSGHSFFKGLHDHPVYKIDEICELLLDMASNNPKERGRAQGILFQGGIEKDGEDDKEDPQHKKFPFFEMSWGCAGMVSDEEIVQRFITLLQKNVKAIGESGLRR